MMLIILGSVKWLVHSAFCLVLGHPSDGEGAGVAAGGNKSSVSDIKCVIGGSNGSSFGFRMPLHYPRYTKADYEDMEEWRLDLLLGQYGFSYKGTLHQKRAFAMGAFLWPHQY